MSGTVTEQTSLYGYTEVKRPSRWQYVIGIVITLAAFGIGMGLFAVDMLDSPDMRIAVPGTHELEFNDTGKYTIFYEYRSSLDGKVYSTGESLSGMMVAIQHKDSGAPVSLSSNSGNASYEVSGRAGVSVLEFKIDEPGKYILTAEYSDGRQGTEVVFAIDKFDIMSIIFQTLGIVFGGGIIGAIIIIRAFIKRRKVGKQPGVYPVDRVLC